MRSVSTKDLAARAGVSLGTVTSVLNRPDAVSPATTARAGSAAIAYFVLDSGATHEHQHVVFPPELIARASTAAPRTVAS